MVLNIEPINEVYFGKTPELQKIENQLGKFRSKYMEQYINCPHCNNDPDLIKFNRMMEDQFGFGCFCLHILNRTKINAFTVSIDKVFDNYSYQKNLIADKKTFKYNKKAGYSCMLWMYTGMIFNPDFSTEEVMALIMHEVGHNFNVAINGFTGVLSRLYCIAEVLQLVYSVCSSIENTMIVGGVSITALLATNSKFREAYSRIDRFCRENNLVIADIFNYVEYTITLFLEAKGTINNILDLVTLGLFALIKEVPKQVKKSVIDPFTWIFLPEKLNNEKTADNFATMYGYGPALSTALNKMNGSVSAIDNGFDKIPILSNIYSINNSITTLILMSYDEHPDNISRIQDQLNMLKREAAKEDLDPKMRKVIIADAAACEKEIQKMIKLEDGIKDKEFVTKVWDKFVYDHLQSRRLKDIIFAQRNKFEVYDKVYNDKLNNYN